MCMATGLSGENRLSDARLNNWGPEVTLNQFRILSARRIQVAGMIRSAIVGFASRN